MYGSGTYTSGGGLRVVVQPPTARLALAARWQEASGNSGKANTAFAWSRFGSSGERRRGVPKDTVEAFQTKTG